MPMYQTFFKVRKKLKSTPKILHLIHHLVSGQYPSNIVLHQLCTGSLRCNYPTNGLFCWWRRGYYYNSQESIRGKEAKEHLWKILQDIHTNVCTNNICVLPFTVHWYMQWASTWNFVSSFSQVYALVILYCVTKCIIVCFYSSRQTSS